jgi:serine/threonine protein kinase
VVAGRYEILEELGRGANGIAYLGRDRMLDRVVVLKTPRTDHGHLVVLCKRLKSEARTLSKLELILSRKSGHPDRSRKAPEG